MHHAPCALLLYICIYIYIHGNTMGQKMMIFFPIRDSTGTVLLDGQPWAVRSTHGVGLTLAGPSFVSSTYISSLYIRMRCTTRGPDPVVRAV